MAEKHSGSLSTKSLYILKVGLWADYQDEVMLLQGRKTGRKFKTEILKG